VLAAWGLSPALAGAASGFQSLYIFPRPGFGPAHPATSLTEDGHGDFFGTTAKGGNGVGSGNGTIFKLSKSGVFTVLCSFDFTNGFAPFGGLTRIGADFYGTTRQGGSNYVASVNDGDGTVFRVTTNGVLTSLFSFRGTNGHSPSGSLLLGPDGNLYGTTQTGGTFDGGTLFRISTNGAFTSLVSFVGNIGSLPNPVLAIGSDGRIYGTTQYGGSNASGLFTGNGTAFAITTNGALSTFYLTTSNGTRPSGGLIAAVDGNLWGVAAQGGTGNGTVFRMSTNGEVSAVFQFNGTNGSAPMGGLAQTSDGCFYGTTSYSLAAPDYYGTVFRLLADGQLTTLARLDGTNGTHPFTSLTVGSDGSLYGAMADATATYPANGGTLFRLVPSPVFQSIVRTGASFVLTWSSFSNCVYTVESTPSLVSNWTVIANNVVASSNRVSFTNNPGPGPQRYFRVGLSY
jgi:uncharacterized repeat protein (TIGR03803 family)